MWIVEEKRNIGEEETYRFIFDNIDTVPHLEALLLLWNSRPKQWSEVELTARLFVNGDMVREILSDLRSHQMVSSEFIDGEERYSYHSISARTDDVIDAVAATYRRELVQVSRAIHSKASSGAREFGRAFKFKKDTD